MPYIIGTVRIDSNVIWYGNQQNGVVYIASVGLDGTITSVPSYQQTVDVQFGMCSGPGVHLVGIYGQNNEVIWTGDVGVSPRTFTPTLQVGIFSGSCTWYSGEFDQPVDPDLAANIIGNPVPAFVGTAYLMVTGGDSGNNYALSFECRRLPDPLALGRAINVSPDGADINLATMVIDFMTSKWNGGGNDIGIFDTASFVSAATILASEGNFGSCAVTNEGVTPDDVITQVEDQADGTIFTHPATGLITFRLFRENSVDLDDPTLPVFSADEIQDHPQFEKTTWDGAVNQVRVMYSDRTQAYAQLPAIAQTIEVASAGGRARLPVTKNFPMACTAALGNALAARELALASTPRYAQTITTDRKGAYLLPGDVILIDWDNYGQTRTPYYVKQRDDNPKPDNNVSLQLSQFQSPPNNALFPPPESSGYLYEVHDPLPPLSVRIMDAPYYLASRRALGVFSGVFITPYEAVSNPMVLAEPAGHFQYAWNMQYDVGFNTDRIYLIGPPNVNPVPGTANANVTTGPYCAVGQLQTAISEWDGITNGTLSTIVITGVFRTLIGPALVALVGQYFFIDDEIFYWDIGTTGVSPITTAALVGNTLTISNLRRARIDTVKQAHSVGADVRILYIGALSGFGQSIAPALKYPDNGAMSPFPVFQFTGGAYFNGKFSGESPTALTGQTYDGYEPGKRNVRPLRPHNTKIGANARSSSPVAVVRSATATITWRTRSRWVFGTVDDAGGSEIQYGAPNSTYLNQAAQDFDFQQNSMYSEYDGTSGKYNLHRVMIKDSAGTVWTLANTSSANYKDKSLLVTWPAGAAVGAGLLWVEQYNDYGDSSRFKDTLPITIS